MTSSLVSDTALPRAAHDPSDRVASRSGTALQAAIEHAAHLLPAQGPITVFIHHNTLHAFEDLSFEEAVKKGGRTFGCQPYLSEERYREELGRGRILFGDLKTALLDDLKDHAEARIFNGCTRLALRFAMLQFPLRSGPTAELRWFIAETDALRRVRADVSGVVRGRLISETRHWVMRDLRGATASAGGAGGQERAMGLLELLERFGAKHAESWSDAVWEQFTLHALWRVCCDGAAKLPTGGGATPPVRHRDLVLQATGIDTDLLVHDWLVRFCGAFLDQGLAHWQLPRRAEGFLRSFCSLYRDASGLDGHWKRAALNDLASSVDGGAEPLQLIYTSLEDLGVPAGEWEGYLSATLLALRGWAGIIRFLEERPDRAVHPVPEGSLIEFLAVRLVLERHALKAALQESLGVVTPLGRVRDDLWNHVAQGLPPSVEQRAFLLFQLSQILGWTPEELHRQDELAWRHLVSEAEGFSALERRRIFHVAYEKRFLTRSLDALSLYPGAELASVRPRFQAMFCIDEREESMRRHLEEVAPDAVTYGIAGFYFVPMYFRGIHDAHYVPLCPAVMKPSYWVVEKVEDTHEDVHQRRLRARRALARATHRFHIGSRTFAVGAILSAAIGVLASIPLVARTLFPRLTARLRKWLGGVVQAAPQTRLHLERRDSAPGPEPGGVGLTLKEMTDIAERVLRDTGLTRQFSRLVLTFGHGSTSMNNPHESAHDCGACGGARGGPNGRAIAQIMNDPRVREGLASRGLCIPTDTVFVGGMHNTSNGVLSYFDVDKIPDSHRAEFEAARALIEVAAERDAHERCRRFHSAPLTLSLAAARQHVEGRAEDLSQVRPEWGHATNALTVVGRRHRTRGLYLDRRAFLNSYDPTQDDAEGTILARVLAAAVPVCAGISLEYYFSYVDNTGYGCGTKLPHNIAALLGVMDGASSDLRTGLPWQMVEIHEPMRHLFVVESTPEIMFKIMDRNPVIGGLVRRGWVYLAVLDPHSSALQVYCDGTFVPHQLKTEQLPWAPSSIAWYRGWRDHLDFARIGN